MERWNGRAVRGALVRLEQTGYLRRFIVEKQARDSRIQSNHFICIQRLREPLQEDIQNLRFKRVAGANVADAIDGEPLETEVAADGSMQDLEQGLMNDVSDAGEDDDADRRIPPQWTPNRLLTNLIVDAVHITGTAGTDNARLRDLTTGSFWKRPLETLIARLTDEWNKNQPMHVRHLALVRDTAMSIDKKRVHYLYRTHQNFQKAVDEGEVSWEALGLDEGKKGARPRKPTPASLSSVDRWGFRELNKADFHKSTGTSSLAESCATIVRHRNRPRDWEAKLVDGDSTARRSSTPGQKSSAANSQSPSEDRGRSQKSKVTPRPLLTQAERLSLGLPAKGRLGVDFESQIRAYREKTGNPSAIPERLVKGLSVDAPKPKPKYERRPGPPLLTREERKARGLPEHGRLSFKVTEQILKEQGRNESLTHMTYSVDLSDEESEDEQDSSLVQSTRELDVNTNKEDAAVLANTHANEEQQSPTKGSGSQKRLLNGSGGKSSRPQKKARRKGIQQDQSIDDHHLVSIDGQSEIDAMDEIGRMETSTPLHHNQTTKASKPFPDLPPTIAGLQGRKDMEGDDVRRETGVYFDSSATRPGKGGRGRPKKAFMATFKLPALHQLKWFAPNTTNQDESRALSSTTNAGAKAEKPRLKKGSAASPLLAWSPVNGAPKLSHTPSAQTQTAETEEHTSSPSATLVTPANATRLHDESATVVMDIQETAESAPESTSATIGIDLPFDGAPLSQEGLSEHPLRASLSVGPETESAAPEVSDSNQHPRRPAAAPGPTHTEAAVTNVNVARTTPQDPSHEGTVEPDVAMPTPKPPRNRPKPEKDRGVVLGQGSVAHARTRIIRHIFDLCGGVFPGLDVLYPVFVSLWEECGPKTAMCPAQTTIRITLNGMKGLPLNLRTCEFSIPRPGLIGQKMRTVYYYDRFESSSPEVSGMIKKIIQAWPDKYVPPEVRKYWREEVRPAPVRPKIDNSFASEFYPVTSRKTDERILEVRRERRKMAKAAKEEQRRRDREAKKEQRRLEKEQRRQERLQIPGSRRKLFKERQRLGGLNAGPHIGAGNRSLLAKPAQLPLLVQAQQPEDTAPPASSSDDEPLINTRPRPTPGPQAATVSIPISDEFVQLDVRVHRAEAFDPVAGLMSPSIGYHSSTHTFSTHFSTHATSEVKEPKKKTKSRKRVRIEQGSDQVARKRPRNSLPKKSSLAKQSQDNFLERHHIQIHEDSDDEDDDAQEDVNEVRSPTIVQRLAGLTGDLNKPDYEPITRKKQHRWNERDRQRKARARDRHDAVKERKYPEAFDPTSEFKKLCYTLVVASSMAGQEGKVDWDIVKQVYSESPRFDLEKTKKTWAWLQSKMAHQLRGMTGSFQSQFLSAYEEGKVDPIEDPTTYDWGKLVSWALSTCTHVEPPLPLAREVLDDCQFDLSSYDILDRTVWYNTALANINRDERFAKFAFGSPLHGKRKVGTPGDLYDLQARTLIRANTSTPKEFYDKTLAHDKLRKLPVSVIERSVNDLVQASLIRQRKIKRLLPGRNYHFGSGFAKNYRRTFELGEFMTAVQLKKDLDATFTNADPDKRTYLVSRDAENGTVMALISLASDGKIKLVPQLPSINNDFDAPVPRISVWGFSEGDYEHRLMDRKRLFWPLTAVPTDTYDYGSPLRPTPTPSAPTEASPIVWNPMPEPPLPGRTQGPDTLLPIWSTIDGQNVIYPWWNRILNIVIQALLFQPSITAQEIFSHCETYTTEVFEIQLVLDWIVDTEAAKRSPHGTYELLPGYWAVFGDKLVGDETDEYGEHVKRPKTNNKFLPTWRTEYNNEYSLRSQQVRNSGERAPQGDNVSAGEQILGNVRKQYTIVKNALQKHNMASASSTGDRPSGETETVSHPTGLQQEDSVSNTPTPPDTPSTQDVDMTDADADDGQEDVDAEGESDDEYL